MTSFSYYDSNERFCPRISLSVPRENEKIDRALNELLTNFKKYRSYEWRVKCHDAHGSVFEFPFILNDVDFSFQEQIPDVFDDFDYVRVRLDFVFKKDEYLRRTPIDEEEYFYLNSFSTIIRSIEITEDEIILSEWVNG